jgi:hypothetical protein
VNIGRQVFHRLRAAMFYGGKQMRVGCGAICLIALFSDQESNQEKGASKQLAPHSRIRIG